jgi:LytS/YehU family sensor histidine kinase
LLVCSILALPLIGQLGFSLGTFRRPFTWMRSELAGLVLGNVLVGCLAAAPIYLRQRRQSAIRELRDAKLLRVNAERQENEVRLQSLQAQIEPHFLFNTLAHILRLHQVDAQRGRAMLQSLTEYMRSALPQMRGQKDFTLGRELALTRAYVNVQQIRMGERLRVEIDVPSALMAARVPPMAVLTLAENAVKHGLGPKGEGGTVRIEATLKGEVLEVAVCDDGVGLRLGAGTGHGLSNTRSRLAAAYGSRAALEIGNRDTGGVRAALLLPFVLVAMEGAAQ